MQNSLSGVVSGVFLCQDESSLVSARQKQVTVTFDGFEGDKHSGLTRSADGRTPYYPRGVEIRNDRQVSIVSVEELAQTAALLDVPEILAEWLGANLSLKDIPGMSQLLPSTRLVFSGGAVLVVTHENGPCTSAGKILREQYRRPELETMFPKAAIHKRGLVAMVEKPGSIHEGDVVSVDPFVVSNPI